MQTQKLQETGFIRLDTVLQLIPIGKTSWWDGIKSGIYPKPIRIGKRAVAWKVEDIRELIDRLSNDK